MSDKEMYEMVCDGRFDKLENAIEKSHEETMAALKGTDTQAGICERVRVLEKAYSKIMAGGIFVLAAIGLQIISAAFGFIKGLFKG